MSKVLVAEDNPLNYELVLHVLESRGHEVEWAQDGEEAVNLVRRHTFDVLLVDLHMPKLDGLGVVRVLRADPRFEELRIIALTADAMPGVQEELLEAGADAYLTKPLNIAGLIAAVALARAG
jgi:two-component system cell cycle response regulator DivK